MTDYPWYQRYRIVSPVKYWKIKAHKAKQKREERNRGRD